MSPVPTIGNGERRTIPASDVWTGDVLLPGDKIVTELKRSINDDGSCTHLVITVADVVPGDTAGIPLEVKDPINVRSPLAEPVGVIRGRPLFNGMHMTQFDLDGKCHGGAHPALEQRLRAEGRMAQ